MRSYAPQPGYTDRNLQTTFGMTFFTNDDKISESNSAGSVFLADSQYHRMAAISIFCRLLLANVISFNNLVFLLSCRYH